MARLKFLDGMRGWAAVFVLLYHVFCDAIPFDAVVAGTIRFFLPFNGTMAVLIFFLASGFSLSVGYLAHGDFQAWLRLVAGRYFRLAIPVLGACALVHIAMHIGAIDPPTQRLTKFQDMLLTVPDHEHLIISSLYSVFFDYDYRTSYIGLLWSMQLEMIGSVAVLLAVLFARSLPYRSLIFAGIAFAFLVVGQGYFAMLALFPIGCVAADFYLRGWLELIPQSVAAALVTFGVAVPLLFPYSVAVWGGIGVTSLIFGSIAWHPLCLFLENRLSAWLGELCFPLYLVHGPILWLVGEPLMRRFGQDTLVAISIDILTIALSFLAAMLFSPVNTLAISVSKWVGYTVTRQLQRYATS